MKYRDVVVGKFINRPNRFVAEVEIEGRKEMVHVKNTGRCRELLVTGVKVYMEDYINRMGTRKMRYSLISVEKEVDYLKNSIVNMDSQAPNKAVEEFIENLITKKEPFFKGLGIIKKFKREYTYGNSRIDFYLEDEDGNRGLLEVKGVTLENYGYSSFPDAPTDRGRKHLEELAEALKYGYKTYVFFLIQMKGVKSFSPNEEKDPKFAKTLRNVVRDGVVVMAYDAKVTSNSMEVDEAVEIIL